MNKDDDCKNSFGIDYIKDSDFQSQSIDLTNKWDKEWMRYFSLGKDYSFYFYNMDTDNYALNISKETIRSLLQKDFFSARLVKNIKAGLWLKGADIVDKDILEIGCGPGIFGRIASRLVNSYTGIDVSLFALHIAKLCSPKGNIKYIHLFDYENISSLQGSMDVCFGRNFFIHHNYKDSLWLLSLLRDLTKPNGLVLADFHHDPDHIDGLRRLDANNHLSDDYASALYSFDDIDIIKIGEQANLILEKIDTNVDHKCKYVRFRRP